MANNLDLTFKISHLVKRGKLADGGFKYVCDQCEFDCLGRKKIINHIKEKHLVKLNEIQEEYEENGNKDFESQLSKVVMNVPFCEKDIRKIINYEANKDYPVTLDFMKIIDSRTTRIPNFGSLLGRLARLLAMVVTKEQFEEMESEEIGVKLTCMKCRIVIGKVSNLFQHLEKSHIDFLDNLKSMFPLATERMEQFIHQAATKFDLVVPTGKEVEVLQLVEDRSNLEYNIKRKIENDHYNGDLPNSKVCKIDANIVSSEESLRRKKEISLIEKALNNPNISEVRKNRLTRRLSEIANKVKENETMKKEVKFQLKMKPFLDKLNPNQLRKLCMEYFDNLENFQTIRWKSICESANIDEDLEFIIGFLGALYDLAKVNGKSSFKVGHILVTSKQCATIVEKGFRSYRDFVKNEVWRMPTSWKLESPRTDLGENWNSDYDSRLLIGASRFGKNLSKIINFYPNMKAKAQDSFGSILESLKERFGYLLNIYQNRGTFQQEMGLCFYTGDIEEEEILEEVDGQEEGEI